MSDVDNLHVKVTCYTKYGLPITGFANAIFQLPLIVSYIHNKKNSNLSNECVEEIFILINEKTIYNCLMICFKVVY